MINYYKDNPIIVGCNYHTTWQSHKAMRFKLVCTLNNRAHLKTTRTNKDFWTDVSDLIFITSTHNIQKARRIYENRRRD